MEGKIKELEARNAELQAKNEELEGVITELNNGPKPEALPKFKADKNTYQFTAKTFEKENVRYNAFDIVKDANSKDKEVAEAAQEMLAKLVTRNSGIIKEVK